MGRGVSGSDALVKESVFFVAFEERHSGESVFFVQESVTKDNQVFNRRLCSDASNIHKNSVLRGILKVVSSADFVEIAC